MRLPRARRPPFRLAWPAEARRGAKHRAWTRLAAVVVILVGCSLLAAGQALALPEYASRTGKPCDYCHSTGGAFTPEGEAFRDAGYQLPSEARTPDGADSPEGEAAGGGVGEGAEPQEGASVLLSLPQWLRSILRGAHLLAALVWLGAMVSVFLVQRTQIADTGIPAAYIKLAWPAIAVVGLSGLPLALGMVSDSGMLTASRWGQILLAKIVLYLGFVFIAGSATFVVSPRLRRLAEQTRPARSQEQFKAQGRITVLYRGRVYDVTGSRLWPEGRHARRHDAWQDLTTSLEKAPHGTEVFARFQLLEDAGEQGPLAVKRLFIAMMALSVVLALSAVFLLAIW
jgi:predicted heme/steroid binding protein